jgi:hypothetical protein
MDEGLKLSRKMFIITSFDIGEDNPVGIWFEDADGFEKLDEEAIRYVRSLPRLAVASVPFRSSHPSQKIQVSFQCEGQSGRMDFPPSYRTCLSYRVGFRPEEITEESLLERLETVRFLRTDDDLSMIFNFLQIDSEYRNLALPFAFSLASNGPEKELEIDLMRLMFILCQDGKHRKVDDLIEFCVDLFGLLSQVSSVSEENGLFCACIATLLSYLVGTGLYGVIYTFEFLGHKKFNMKFRWNRIDVRNIGGDSEFNYLFIEMCASLLGPAAIVYCCRGIDSGIDRKLHRRIEEERKKLLNLWKEMIAERPDLNWATITEDCGDEWMNERANGEDEDLEIFQDSLKHGSRDE